MRTSQNGLAFIKRWEGFVAHAYRDVAGVMTIGYGHTKGFRDGRFGPDAEVSAGAAERLLRKDLAPVESKIDRLVRTRINQNEFDALASFDFNTGALHRATALKLLNAENRIGAAEALTWWNKASVDGRKIEIPGLTRRRAAEADLFLSPPGARRAFKQA
ncbi:MAG: lysozyme [Pseudomonadota bacterium]